MPKTGKRRNSTRKGVPFRRNPRPKNLKGLEEQEPDDEVDYREGESYGRFQNVFQAFLKSQWAQRIKVSVGTAGRSFGFHPYVNDAITMLTASREIQVIEHGLRSFLVKGPGMPLPGVKIPYGERILRRVPEVGSLGGIA